MPFAPSFDTVGWFAPDSLLLRDVGRCLLPPQDRPATRRLMIVQDAFALLSDDALAPLNTAVSRLREWLPAVEVTLASDGLESWATVFRIHQGYEIWESLGAWVTANHPLFGPGIKERFAWASTISKDEFEGAQRSRAEIRRRILDVVGDDGVLILPTAPDIAPVRATPSSELETFRNKALQLLCIAGLAGTPQINIPGESSSGCPIGLSISGSTGSDFALLDFCTTELP
jgi:amidase